MFVGKFGVLSFLVTPVLRFAFLLYYRRVISSKKNKKQQKKLQGNTINVMHRFIIMRTNQDQIINDETDRKCVKNLLRFLSNNVARRKIDERLNCLEGIFLYWINEISDYFKNKKK